MKVSVIHNSIKYPEAPYEVTALLKAGEEMSIPVHMANLHAGRAVAENIADLGNVVIYRTSDLTSREERTEHLAAIMEDRTLLNEMIVAEANVRFKAWQQQRIAEQTDLNTISTFRATSHDELAQLVANGQLAWPFIQKPNGGVKGKDVALVQSMDEVVAEEDIGRFIFQPFIKHDGDCRVLLIGGEVVGIMKRTAAPGTILNNISQGGQGTYVKDAGLIRELTTIGQAVISAFPLHIAGLDVIKDEDTGTLYFLEINLMPGWRGFEEVAGVGVGKRIIAMCQALHEGRFTWAV